MIVPKEKEKDFDITEVEFRAINSFLTSLDMTKLEERALSSVFGSSLVLHECLPDTRLNVVRTLHTPEDITILVGVLNLVPNERAYRDGEILVITNDLNRRDFYSILHTRFMSMNKDVTRNIVATYFLGEESL